MNILITGGCGFVGSNLALYLKAEYPRYNIMVLDNLKRRGSELNIQRLKRAEVVFIHGDMRCREDLFAISDCNLLIDASAEPSVLAGLNDSGRSVIDHNLLSTINALDFCVARESKLLFLSTSRVYPIHPLEEADFVEESTRFNWSNEQHIPGISANGISENFPLNGHRSLYGATKLASELLIQEYQAFLNVPAIINRCGVISGPWQMGKIDQGVVVLWLARHMYQKSLQYIGYGGLGKQVRDILHIGDLCRLIDVQIHQWEKGNGQIFNVGGGLPNSISLRELTELVSAITGNTIHIDAVPENRPADLRIYITDNNLISKTYHWTPQKDVSTLLIETYQWMQANEQQLKHILE